MRHSLLLCTLLTASLTAVQAHAQFKPRYYADCYAALATARELVPSPPADLKKTACTVTKVAGIASSLGGLAGFGGFGGRVARTSAPSLRVDGRMNGQIEMG